MQHIDRSATNTCTKFRWHWKQSVNAIFICVFSWKFWVIYTIKKVEKVIIWIFDENFWTLYLKIWNPYPKNCLQHTYKTRLNLQLCYTKVIPSMFRVISFCMQNQIWCKHFVQYRTCWLQQIGSLWANDVFSLTHVAKEYRSHKFPVTRWPPPLTGRLCDQIMQEWSLIRQLTLLARRSWKSPKQSCS